MEERCASDSGAGAGSREWLETDGLGGFASGTAGLVRTRRYHALLLSATKPPAGRFALVNGFEAWAETSFGRVALSSQEYVGDVRYPDGVDRVTSFGPDPWPHWTFRLTSATRIEHEIFVSRERAATVLFWRAAGKAERISLDVRPLLSGRDYHALHRENSAFRFEPEKRDESWTWRPYDGVPAVTMASNGEYAHDPVWYRNFLYAAERDRGLDCVEDLASPGTFRFDLSRGGSAILLLTSGDSDGRAEELEARVSSMRRSESRRRRSFRTRLERAGDDYLVRRGTGKTIVAGYPWFTDWGRDTFISLRGLCLATGRLGEAREILVEWSGAVSEGMLPNRFPDSGEAPEYNAVDASLWYVVAVHEYLAATLRRQSRVPAGDRQKMLRAVDEILEGYARGTRYGIHADDDGLLAAGEPGVQLTSAIGSSPRVSESRSRSRPSGSTRSGSGRGRRRGGRNLPTARRSRFSDDSGERRLARSATSWTAITSEGPPTRAFAPTRSSPLAGSPSRCSPATAPAEWSRRSRRGS